MECKQRSVSDISDAGQIVTQLYCRIYPTWGSEGVKHCACCVGVLMGEFPFGIKTVQFSLLTKMGLRSTLRGELAIMVRALTVVSRVISFFNLSKNNGRHSPISFTKESPRLLTICPLKKDIQGANFRQGVAPFHFKNYCK